MNTIITNMTTPAAIAAALIALALALSLLRYPTIPPVINATPRIPRITEIINSIEYTSLVLGRELPRNEICDSVSLFFIGHGL